MKELLRKEILQTVMDIDISDKEFVSVTEYENLVKDNVWTKAIQTALDEKKNVYIPYMKKEILIDGSIFMDSYTNLKVDEKQVIRLIEGTNVCMLRNRNILPGNTMYVDKSNPDKMITVSGGIWASDGNTRLRMDKLDSIVGSFAVMAFSNAEFVNVKNVALVNGSSYAGLITNCENFLVDNIDFEKYGKDGIHVNGPTKYGIIRNLTGAGLGDDMVALNAWDWCTSAHAFGSIEKILVEDIKGSKNEIRLLAGRKIYPNGKTADCNLKDCVFQNITGIYVYKMYYQPNCKNVLYRDRWYDYSPVCGEMENIYFDNIQVPEIRNIGISNIPVLGIFDILADCRNINISNVSVQQSYEELEKYNVKLVNAGPISATWKYYENKEDWADFFNPDMCCTVEDITIKNITFNGIKVSDADKLTKETKQKINPDFPNTIPQGGTGFGVIRKVTVE